MQVTDSRVGLRIWNALTDNYGNVMPVDWKSSHTRALHLPTLNLSEKGVNDNLNLDLSDDEELREQLDMHSIIVSCINDEPLFTAEQVIEEIEEMMQESPDPEDDETPTQSDRLSILSQEIQTLKRSSTNNSYEERVKRLSVAELNELLEEIETAIKDYSEELVQQLALRDELEFEKEVKNSFISVLIEVQNKQREHKETAKKKKKLKNGSPQNGKQERGHMPGTRFSMEGISNVIQNGLRHTFGNSGGEKQYLTTVIPYEKKNGPPSVEDLQTLTKILHAMKEDSEKVPSLLTDYILKVLCPT
ncbi:PREDICTED: fasciculation and elongation protein zeta-2 [Tinamus guttatus]|uniref:fasciculation and elongation protein zeta-2 n=1 Tax=Tinamus guttatus TaxID=94827 RepID=UPI00052EC65E|nr:PREDICTED: fasciculation and elongation protein zeta-2 [Tinamus guttatus]